MQFPGCGQDERRPSFDPCGRTRKHGQDDFDSVEEDAATLEAKSPKT